MEQYKLQTIENQRIKKEPPSATGGSCLLSGTNRRRERCSLCISHAKSTIILLLIDGLVNRFSQIREKKILEVYL